MKEVTTVGDYRLKISYDEISDSPRDWCNLGTFITWERGSSSPDTNDFARPEDFMEWWTENGEGGVLLPVFKFEHSGVAYSTVPFGDRWDSGQVGFIYALAGTIEHDLIDKDRTEECLQAEVVEYSQWANGEVYSYTLERRVAHECGCDNCDYDGWDLVDSCGGYVGGIDLRDLDLPTEILEAASKLSGVFDTRVSSK